MRVLMWHGMDRGIFLRTTQTIPCSFDYTMRYKRKITSLGLGQKYKIHCILLLCETTKHHDQ